MKLFDKIKKYFGKTRGHDGSTEGNESTKGGTMRGMKVEKAESLLLRMSGMRGTREYEMNCMGEETKLALYQIMYGNEEDRRKLLKKVSLKTDSVTEALNGFGFCDWDGFHGSHPKGVRDGMMFHLEAFVNGGHKIQAEGSANFPKNFRDFERWLSETLQNGEA